MRRVWLPLAFCVLAWVPPVAADPRPYLDLDFEMPECTGGWNALGLNRLPYDVQPDRSVVRSGEQSMRIRYNSPFPWSPQIASVILLRTLDPAEVAGRRVRLSGSIRTEGLTGAGGYASLFWSGNAPSGNVYAETFDGARGTTPWTRYAVELDIPADASNTFFGVQLYGDGAAWFDDLKVEVDGRELKQGPMPRLDRPAPGHASWLRRRVIPFDTPLAGSGSADLQPLKAILGGARIVSLGEATHGTREFFQMKHRLLEFLVEEMGFTHFAMEANMPEADRLNDYVRHGIGDPAALLRGLHWVWNTREVLDLILWMRQYNASGKGPVQFTGFDIQSTWVAVQNLRGFLARADAAYLTQAEPFLARLLALHSTRRPTAGDLAAARGLFDHLSGHRESYVTAGQPAPDVDWAIQNARIAVQLIEHLTGFTARDRSMAENVEWILDHAPAGSKIVLWAHNAHVSRVPARMGEYLTRRYGDDMYILGFAFDQGLYNALTPLGSVAPQETAVTAPDQVEGLLAATGLPRFIVDFRGLGSHGPARWFHEQRLMKLHGTLGARCSFGPVVAAEHFDGLIWFTRSSPSSMLPLN